MRPAILCAGGLGCLFAWTAAAQPLTCDLFQDRLNGNLIVSDNEAPEAPVFRETGSSPNGTTRLAWRTSSLEGTMTCGPDRIFKEFYVNLAFASRDRFVEQIKRFVALSGAAVCATSDATPPVCTDVGKQLLQTGLQQMGSAFQKKVSAPSGIASRKLQPELTADLTAAPTLITFSLTVNEGASLDAQRAPLAPSSPPAAPPPQPRP
jgi:hypothetical protein